MRISLIIISLFTIMSAMAQSETKSALTNINTEEHRAPITPYATEAGAKSGAEQGVRYTLPITEWERSTSGDSILYKASFTTPFSWLNRQARIRIQSAAMPYVVIVNGKEIGGATNAALPAEFDYTRSLKSKNSQITIALVENAKTKELEGWAQSQLPELGAVDAISQPALHLRDIEMSTEPNFGVINASIDLIVKSEMLNSRTSRFHYTITPPEGYKPTLDGSADISLGMRGEDTIRLFTSIPDSMAWSAEAPNLFTLKAHTQYRGRNEEFISFNIGLRTIEMDADGSMKINGKAVELKVEEVGADISAQELASIKAKGYNTVKIAAGRYNPDIYNWADINGLYIIATVPINTSLSGDTILYGGNPTNDPAREAEFIERSDALYNTLKLHPSVIAFSLADKSLNGYNLYQSYLYLKSKDSHRPIIYTDGANQWNNDKLRHQE